MSKIKWSLVLGVLAAVLAVGTAMALPPQVDPAKVPYGFLVSGSHVTDAPVWPFARVLSARDGIEVFTVHSMFPPGQSLGWHSHPGPNIHNIVSGVLTVYNADDPTCMPHTYGPGQGFIDPGYGNVHIGRNESATVPADFYVVFLNPAGVETWSTPEPAPGNCPSSIR